MYTPGPQTQQPPQTPPPQAAPQPQEKPKAPGKSKGNTDVGAFIQQLISLMAYVHQLQVQSHLIHFNFEGSNFLGVHKFLGKQYEAHIEQFDKLGDRTTWLSCVVKPLKLLGRSKLRCGMVDA